MRTITNLTNMKIERIRHDAPKRCYVEIVEELDVGVGTVKRVVRTSRLKRYNKTSNTTSRFLRSEEP